MLLKFPFRIGSKRKKPDAVLSSLIVEGQTFFIGCQAFPNLPRIDWLLMVN